MTDITRIYCSRCGESVYNCTVDPAVDEAGQAIRIPIVHRITSGQVPDSGPPVDLCAAGVKVTSFTREMMAVPVARLALGERCFSEVFGLPRVEAASDPMWDVNNDKIQDALQLNDDGLSTSTKFSKMHTRSLHAIAVGRGVAKPADLPAQFQAPKPALSKASTEELQAELEARRTSGSAA